MVVEVAAVTVVNCVVSAALLNAVVHAVHWEAG
jgi:hypothetical protein